MGDGSGGIDNEGSRPISKRYVVVIIVMVVACIMLVGISYLMLDILSGMVVTPKTRVEETAAAGTLIVPLHDTVIRCMQVSVDGRYLAYIEETEAGGNSVLQVIELDGERRDVFEKEIDGERLAWLGGSPGLVYEDDGDIHRLDAAVGTGENLTASPEYDNDPIPSPDGGYVLWTRAFGGSSDFWVMGANGADKTIVADAQDLAVWDPVGLRVMSRSDTAAFSGEESDRDILQTAVPGQERWEVYAECEGEVEFIWWPARDTVLYVGPLAVKGGDVIKGVWSRVELPDRIKEVASTDGLGSDVSNYLFYPARDDELLAYVGENGLEYLDYEERIIHRYTSLEAEPPLAWNEADGELFYVGMDGIYLVELGEE